MKKPIRIDVEDDNGVSIALSPSEDGKYAGRVLWFRKFAHPDEEITITFTDKSVFKGIPDGGGTLAMEVTAGQLPGQTGILTVKKNARSQPGIIAARWESSEPVRKPKSRRTPLVAGGIIIDNGQ